MTQKIPASMTEEGLTASALAAKANDNAVVHLTGNETIAGTKTFSTQPVLPQAFTQGSAQATTSGVSKDFSIPSWAKRITLLLAGVSTNGTSFPLVRLGSGGIQTTGYSGSGSTVANGATAASLQTGGAQLVGSWGAATTLTMSVKIENVSGNTWVITGVGSTSDVASNEIVGSLVTLAGALDTVRLTTVNGTDTFDAGSVNVLYE